MVYTVLLQTRFSPIFCNGLKESFDLISFFSFHCPCDMQLYCNQVFDFLAVDIFVAMVTEIFHIRLKSCHGSLFSS